MMVGDTRKEIAKELGLSVRTIEACRRDIFEKTQTKSLVDLARLFVEVDPDLD